MISSLLKNSEAVYSSSIENFRIERDKIFDASIIIDGDTYNFRLNEKIRSDHLYVTFNGAVDRGKHIIPVFSRWNWHSLFKAPILSIFDPSLHSNNKLRLGWCVGTNLKNFSINIARMVDSISKQLNIPPDRIICLGSSGGGFSAISVAQHLSHGRFIAINPQTDITRYYLDHVRDFSNFFDPSKTYESNAKEFPRRWSVISALSEIRKQGTNLKGVIIQNTNDLFHYENHYIPFCNSLGLPVDGGVSSDGKLHSELFYDEKGHGPESVEMARYIVSKFMPILLSD
jgi:hypothetical protein